MATLDVGQYQGAGLKTPAIARTSPSAPAQCKRRIVGINAVGNGHRTVVFVQLVATVMHVMTFPSHTLELNEKVVISTAQEEPSAYGRFFSPRLMAGQGFLRHVIRSTG